MKTLNRENAVSAVKYPERILQFGEGNFLRAFCDWMVHRMNKTLDYQSGVVVVQPIENGMADALNAQDGLYHLGLRGVKKEQPVKKIELIDCITRAINPYANFDDYLQAAGNPDIKIVLSNTTEAGISYHPDDRLTDTPQKSFPGKVTALLYHRFQKFNGSPDAGLAFLCCELIDRNADRLKELVLRYAGEWNLGDRFTEWVNNSCDFCNTLVDRIVPGFPKDEIDTLQQEIGFKDNLVVIGEYYHAWVIEAPQRVRRLFPADKAGLEVKFVADNRPYREEKVRILNGAHTGTFATALLSGVETVREAAQDKNVSRFMKEMMFEEIVPALRENDTQLEAFAAKTLERFHNPFIKHYWRSISLNAVSKWETRNLPSLADYFKKNNRLPQKLVFSLAALIAWYRGQNNGTSYEVSDDPEIVSWFAEAWKAYDGTPESISFLVEKTLGNRQFWKKDLNTIKGLAPAVSGYLFLIEKTGMANALEVVLTKDSSIQHAA